jgi:hypothetical protein
LGSCTIGGFSKRAQLRGRQEAGQKYIMRIFLFPFFPKYECDASKEDKKNKTCRTHDRVE